MRTWLWIVAFGIGLVGSSQGCAGEGSEYAFRSASSVAIRHSSTFTGRRYERDVLVEAYRTEALPRLRRCLDERSEAGADPVALVFVISGTGQVSDVVLDRDSELGQCAARELRALVFPPPPFDGFYQQVTLGPPPSGDS